MLKLAVSYKEQLNKLWQEEIFKDKYKFYSNGGIWYDYNLTIDENSWNRLQMVSIDKEGNIIGYLSAEIERLGNMVWHISAINFRDKNITFSKDFHQFLVELFTKYHFRKIEWRVIIGNPAEKIYDKIIEKYNGRIIGVGRKAYVLRDGEICDRKYYEIFKEDFLAVYNNKSLTVKEKNQRVEQPWKPKKGERIWHINARYETDSYIWEDDAVDKAKYKIGNYFRNEGEITPEVVERYKTFLSNSEQIKW